MESAPLSRLRAFVVQYREDPMSNGAVSGRIVHIDSGRCARFASQAELDAFVAAVLEELGESGHASSRELGSGATRSCEGGDGGA